MMFGSTPRKSNQTELPSPQGQGSPNHKLQKPISMKLVTQSAYQIPISKPLTQVKLQSSPQSVKNFTQINYADIQYSKHQPLQQYSIQQVRKSLSKNPELDRIIQKYLPKSPLRNQSNNLQSSQITTMFHHQNASNTPPDSPYKSYIQTYVKACTLSSNKKSIDFDNMSLVQELYNMFPDQSRFQLNKKLDELYDDIQNKPLNEQFPSQISFSYNDIQKENNPITQLPFSIQSDLQDLSFTDKQIHSQVNDLANQNIKTKSKQIVSQFVGDESSKDSNLNYPKRIDDQKESEVDKDSMFPVTHKGIHVPFSEDQKTSNLDQDQGTLENQNLNQNLDMYKKDVIYNFDNFTQSISTQHIEDTYDQLENGLQIIPDCEDDLLVVYMVSLILFVDLNKSQRIVSFLSGIFHHKKPQIDQEHVQEAEKIFQNQPQSSVSSNLSVIYEEEEPEAITSPPKIPQILIKSQSEDLNKKPQDLIIRLNTLMDELDSKINQSKFTTQQQIILQQNNNRQRKTKLPREYFDFQECNQKNDNDFQDQNIKDKKSQTQQIKVKASRVDFLQISFVRLFNKIFFQCSGFTVFSNLMAILLLGVIILQNQIG